MKITENMQINEILDLNPDITEVFIVHGLNCQGCPGARSESLKEAAEGHAVNLIKLIEDINKFLDK